MPSIKKYGYDEAMFDEVAGVCEAEFFQNFNPRKMSKQDCLDIIQKMYALDEEQYRS